MNQTEQTGASVRLSAAIAAANSMPLGEGLLPIPVGMGYLLVVDDEATIRQLTTRLLERLGHRVESACTAAEAIELLTSEPPDVLLCDVGLPDHSGFWVVAQAREQLPHLPIVMISGHSKRPPEAAAIGPVEWLSKPFQRDELVQALGRVLNDRSGS